MKKEHKIQRFATQSKQENLFEPLVSATEQSFEFKSQMKESNSEINAPTKVRTMSFGSVF
jgi:hypothetical protein